MLDRTTTLELELSALQGRADAHEAARLTAEAYLDELAADPYVTRRAELINSIAALSITHPAAVSEAANALAGRLAHESSTACEITI